MNKYTALPANLGVMDVKSSNEMMLYQYLPVKMLYPQPQILTFEERVDFLFPLMEKATEDFIFTFGEERYHKSYVYLTVKCRYVIPSCPLNRPGYHIDGFMTEDINYIWSDKYPTIFNTTPFNLTMHDQVSLIQMENQAFDYYEYTYPDKSLLRLNQYNVHKAADVVEPGMRTFVKISFSADKYDLIGNSRNYLLKYNWDMKERSVNRNIPQTKIN